MVFLKQIGLIGMSRNVAQGGTRVIQVYFEHPALLLLLAYFCFSCLANNLFSCQVHLSYNVAALLADYVFKLRFRAT